jgi:hypothetical protein
LAFSSQCSAIALAFGIAAVDRFAISPLQKGTTPGTTPERIGQDLNLLP